MSRILVTGAAGYLGRHVMNLLRTEGVEALGVDTYLWQNQPRSPGVIEADVTLGIPALVRNFHPTAIIHLAGTLLRNQHNIPAEKIMRHTAGSVAAVREIFPDTPIHFASSISVHGTPVENRTAYTRAKALAAAMLEHAGGPFRVVELGTLYGPPAGYEGFFHPHLLLNQMVLCAVRRRPIWVTHPTLRRPVAHVQIAAGALVFGALNNSSNTLRVSDTTATVLEYAEHVQSLFGGNIVNSDSSVPEISYGFDDTTDFSRLALAPLANFYRSTFNIPHAKHEYA